MKMEEEKQWKHLDLTYSLSAHTEFVDFLEPSSLEPRSLDGSDAVWNDKESSLANERLPDEFILPPKPLSFASGRREPESVFTREIYTSA